MKRNFLLKTTIALLILIGMLTNLSFASSITTANLKNSLDKYFSNDITILRGDGSRTTVSWNNEEELFITSESKIGCKAKRDGTSFNFVNYKLVNNTCIFDIDIEGFKSYVDYSIDENEYYKDLYALIMYVGQFQLLQNCYSATADAVGQDVSLAYTYFGEQIEKVDTEDSIHIKNDIFQYDVTMNNSTYDLTKATLSINLDKLKDLSKSMINTTTYYYVILGKASLSNCTISSISNKSYTGSYIKPIVTVKYKGVTLNQGIDYTVSYSNNKNTGKATATIKGIGSFSGTTKKTFIITPKKVTGLTNKTQDTKSITLKWSKTIGASGYEVYKYDSSKKKYVKVKTTTSTSYKVAGLKAGTTYKFKVRAYKTIDEKKYYGSYSSVKSLTTKTSTPKISKVTAGSKKATVKWNKTSGASGYEIYMATSKNGKYKKIKTITKGSTVSYTKTRLTRNKKYYFKVRTYRTVDGKKVYSSYSAIKYVKVK